MNTKFAGGKLMDIQKFTSSGHDISLSVHIKIFGVLFSKRSIVSIEFMNCVYQHIFLPDLSTFRSKIIIVEQISRHKSFSLNPAMFAWNGSIADLIMIII